MNAGFVAVTSCTSSTKRASRCVGALVERVLADHVRRREQEQVRLGVARVRRRRPRACSVRVVARADRCRQVDAQRRRLVPENFAMMFVLFVCLVLREVRSGNRVDERCRFERQAVRPFTPEKEARPSQLTGVWSRPENQSGGGHWCSAD